MAMTIKKEHYKISLVLGEDGNISMHIQLRSPYMGHVIMKYSESEPKNSMEVFKNFLHALADEPYMTEDLEAIGNIIELKNDISKMCTEYREITW